MKEYANDLVIYRMSRAKETFQDAELLADGRRWNACINRLYYSCFYAVSALLLKNNFSSSKHTGIRSLFNRHFVKSGIIPRQMAVIYNDLFEKRQEGDYIDFVYFTEEEAAPLVLKTESFIECIEKNIKMQEQNKI